ncbi:zinc finger protein 169 [Coprinopsis cinerea AmutBmut pab1-1]|nr:zinc finger protein 169 [Coprinopsis cinerea AmutBmut pab1-1]
MSSSQRMQSMGDPRGYPWPISTRVDRPHLSEDDDRTPTARYPTQSLHPYRYPPHDEPRPSNPVPTSKYECHYCGKGFNRPSSLKIHLNSHTGEKPFACPVEGCGRSFSVLSNMRRHARVHTTNAGKEKEASSDEGALSSTSHSNSETGFSGPSNDPKWLQRRGSIASSTSSSSRRSRSASSDDEDDEDDHRPAEKRSRRVT